jgi:hypothetical protein
MSNKPKNNQGTKLGQSEPAPTSTPWRMMDGKWWGNNFLLGSRSLLVNHGGYLSCIFLLTTYLLTTHKQVVSE